jgi:uncharacterized protein
MSRIIIVPGLYNSGSDHWQSWLEGQLPQARRIQVEAWDQPSLESWCDGILACLSPWESSLLVAHSFGCLASIRAARLWPQAISGLALVAPADPEKFGLSPARFFEPLATRSVLVGSEDDPWLGFAKAERLAHALGADFINLGRAGHINARSGFGAWPGGLKLVQGLRRPRVRSFRDGAQALAP